MKTTDVNTCILCLTEKKESVSYLSTIDTNEGRGCTCNPAIHKRCLTKWYKVSGKKCPQCLQSYYIYPDNQNTDNPPENRCILWMIYGMSASCFFTSFLILGLQGHFY